MSDEGSVSIVIPAYNEERSIGSLLERIPRGHEVIVVDDNSTDATAWIAKDHGAKVIKNRKNMGPERSKQAGIAASSGDIIVMMDADGQHDPREIPVLVRPLLKGYDLVLGERPSLPRLTERMMAWMVRRRVPGIRDATTGFRAAWRKRISRIDTGSDVSGTRTILRMRKLGMNITSVRITSKPRRGKPRLRPGMIMLSMLSVIRNVIFY